MPETETETKPTGVSKLRTILTVGGVLVGLAILFSTISQPNVPAALIGKPAPDIPLPLVDGGTVNLPDLRGDVVVLDFWATWCMPCRISMPVVDRVAAEYADRGVQLYFINEGESPETVRAFLATFDVNAQIALDKEMTMGQAFEAIGLPFTVVIDRDGVVRQIRMGASPDLEAELRSDIEPLLGS
jgi:thiol-disulfide isomerase/thioredoxin